MIVERRSVLPSEHARDLSSDLELLAGRDHLPQRAWYGISGLPGEGKRLQDRERSEDGEDG